MISFSKPRPCIPSPCGANAICKENNDVGSCSCLSDYIGNPYEGCRPECSINTDCEPSKACIQSKCRDPCPGTCGQNAVCQVINHIPSCSCLPRFTGDPFQFCREDLQGIFPVVLLKFSFLFSMLFTRATNNKYLKDIVFQMILRLPFLKVLVNLRSSYYITSERQCL